MEDLMKMQEILGGIVTKLRTAFSSSEVGTNGDKSGGTSLSPPQLQDFDVLNLLSQSGFERVSIIRLSLSFGRMIVNAHVFVCVLHIPLRYIFIDNCFVNKLHSLNNFFFFFYVRVYIAFPNRIWKSKAGGAKTSTY